jgi:mono/diheme cytochrome c family protein
MCQSIDRWQGQLVHRLRIPARTARAVAIRFACPLALLACCAGSGNAVAAQGASDRAPLEYNRDIRPILAENCFACHGPDSAARKADLRLDKREAAIEMGAITPNDPAASELITRINSKNRKEVMPPPSTTKTLTPEQSDRLTRWIAEGAAYQPHWSLIAPKRPQLPSVKHAAWVRNPIDRFILAKLEQAGLAPAPEADRRTLARRLSLDLTGLPPEPADVEAFVNDSAPNAYELFVTRLLDSPRWGEHRARYWLDAARYADTNGYHFDNYREAWAYRDWVIGAFNRNLPFDQFTIEQIAGDLLPHATLDQQVATGFNRCNMTTNEGGVIPEEYQVLYTRDRTEAVSQVWMGTTAGCAVCHDHKFDPLTQREFYELAAFFNNTTQPVMDGNVQDTPPTVFVPSADDRLRWESSRGERSNLERQLAARKKSARADFEKWLAGINESALEKLIPTTGLHLAVATESEGAPAAPCEKPEGRASVRAAELPPRAPGGRADSSRGSDGAAPSRAIPGSGGASPSRWAAAHAGDFEKDHAFSFGAWVKIPKSKMTGAVIARMNNEHGYQGWDLWLEQGRPGTHILNSWPDDGLKVKTKAELRAGAWAHVFVTYDGSGRSGGVNVYINGERQETITDVDRLKNSIRTNVPFTIGQRHSSDRLDGAAIEAVRIYARVLSPHEIGLLAGIRPMFALAHASAEQRSRSDLEKTFSWWLRTIDPASAELRERLAGLAAEQEAIKKRGTLAHVMHERSEAAMAYLLYRGEYDKRRDPVKADTPDCLPPMPRELPKNRLGLARWLVRPEHPLTARVTVNRFWQEVFGAGLVRTSGDFGVSGELPSHPELLDWLAVEFRESGWDVKRLFRLLVESAAYRQSAASPREKREKDPGNRLLSSGPRFRMDGEMIRDAALCASGLLTTRQGGPSVKPYQPEGVWEAVAMPESNTKRYAPDHGDRLYRRTLYTFWKRSAPPASLEVFNAPTREICTVRRERTDTPLQALVTLNDPQFIEAARALAERALKEAGEQNAVRPLLPEFGIDYIVRRLLSRPLRPEEMAIAAASFAKLNAYYQSHPDEGAKLLAVGESKPDRTIDPATLAAWTMLTNELMNLDEFLNK